MTYVGKNDNSPTPATITPCLYAWRQNRLKSSVEVAKLFKQSTSRKNNRSVYDIDYEPVMLNFADDIPAKEKPKKMTIFI